jgi:NADH-quinone oxidoreductase subunit G
VTDTKPQTDEVTIILDGRPVAARAGEMIIAAAERAGVYIPRFCYHPRMQPVGMCRMCLVDVKGPRGFALTPACFVAVADGQEVVTDSPGVKKAQDGVLEFLLVNHPLDCPVCDKGGECPLQDQTLTFGPGETRFVEEKRHWEKPIALSELVLLDRERCIQCARCTRFADEIAGDPLIDFADRGDQIEVATFPDSPFASYFSGNTVQICPVGALTSKPYRFRARPWDLEQVESTCTLCAVGCRMAVQSSNARLTRYLGIDSDPVNQSWLCDKGRYTFEMVNSENRLTAPLVRKRGELIESSWSEALGAIAAAVQDVTRVHGPGAIAMIGGARLANEDAYAWAKLAKAVLGTDHVDAQLGDGLPAELVLGLPRATIDDVDAADAVVLLAPDLKEELPVLYLRLRAAALTKGVPLIEIAPQRSGLSRYATATLLYRPGEAAAVAAALVAAEAPKDASGGVPAAQLAAARSRLRGANRVVVVLGRPSVAESASLIADAAEILADRLPDARFLSALRRGNVHGALDMGLAPGILPGRVGLDAGRDWYTSAWGSVPAERGMDCTEILAAAADGRIHALFLLGADPLADFPDRQLASRGLAGVGYVVAVDAFLTDSSRKADVVLPVASFSERPGLTTNLEGRITRLAQKLTAPGVAWPDWMIAAELASRLDADLGFTDLWGIWDEVVRLAPSHFGITRQLLNSRMAADGIVAPLQLPAVEPGTGREGGGPGVTGAAASDTGSGTTQGVPAPIDPMSDPGIDAVETHGVPIQATDPGVHAESHPAEPSADLEPPPPLTVPPASAPAFPALDAYSLRLVAGRSLWDAGVGVTQSPSVAQLAAPFRVRVNPTDLQRLGATSGQQVQLHAAHKSCLLEAVADPDVPAGSASVAFNTPDGGASDLIDALAPVTDVRLESIS